MNIGGAVLIILVVAVAVVGMYAIAANTSMTPSADAYGRMPTVQDNLTRSNVSAAAEIAPTSTVFLALIGGGIVMFGAVIFLVAALNHKFNSRY